MFILMLIDLRIEIECKCYANEQNEFWITRDRLLSNYASYFFCLLWTANFMIGIGNGSRYCFCCIICYWRLYTNLNLSKILQLLPVLLFSKFSQLHLRKYSGSRLINRANYPHILFLLCLLFIDIFAFEKKKPDKGSDNLTTLVILQYSNPI